MDNATWGQLLMQALNTAAAVSSAGGGGGVTPAQRAVSQMSPGGAATATGGSVGTLPNGPAALPAPQFIKPQQAPAQKQGFFNDPNNVAKMAIIMDMVGSGLAPQNPFAGIGQKLGQSRLAESAANKSTKFREEAMAQYLRGNLSRPGDDGITDFKIQMDKDGKLKYMATGDLAGGSIDISNIVDQFSKPAVATANPGLEPLTPEEGLQMDGVEKLEEGEEF
jgi:hypothetical protein